MHEPFSPEAKSLEAARGCNTQGLWFGARGSFSWLVGCLALLLLGGCVGGVSDPPICTSVPAGARPACWAHAFVCKVLCGGGAEQARARGQDCSGSCLRFFSKSQKRLYVLGDGVGFSFPQHAPVRHRAGWRPRRPGSSSVASPILGRRCVAWVGLHVGPIA